MIGAGKQYCPCIGSHDCLIKHPELDAALPYLLFVTRFDTDAKQPIHLKVTLLDGVDADSNGMSTLLEGKAAPVAAFAAALVVSLLVGKKKAAVVDDAAKYSRIG